MKKFGGLIDGKNDCVTMTEFGQTIKLKFSGDPLEMYDMTERPKEA